MIIPVRKFLPYPGRPVYIRTEYGVRIALFDQYRWGWQLIDCNHPLQNNFFDMSLVDVWEYINHEDELCELWIENRPQRIKDGEEILKTVKYSWKEKLVIWFHCLSSSIVIRSR